MTTHHSPLITHRNAATLVEVLIAIFCVSIGMISVLVLFPVGLQNMAEAVRENRLSQVAANAEAIADWASIRTDPAVLAAAGSSPMVFVDPIGVLNGWTDDGDASEDNPGIIGRKQIFYNKQTFTNATPPVTFDIEEEVGTNDAIARCSVSPGSPVMVGHHPARFLSMEDDLEFNPNGAPVGIAGQVSRERRYSWAYLWRRSADPRVIDLSIVIFGGRKLAVGGVAGMDKLANKYTFRGPRGSTGMASSITSTFAFTLGQTVATVAWDPNDPVVSRRQGPPIKRGQWVLDATNDSISGNLRTSAGELTGVRTSVHLANGHFYKIEGISDVKEVAANGLLEHQQQIILDRPAKANGFVAVFMPDVVAVIEKSNGRMPR